MAKEPSVARFLLSGGQTLKLTMALPLAEIIHLALVKLSNGSQVFTGCDSSHRPLKGHEHAYILCESNLWQRLGSQGEITHVTIFCRRGFSSHDQNVLQELKHIYGPLVPDAHLSMLGVGHPRDFAGTKPNSDQCPLLAKSRTWISRMPFVPARHPKVTRAGVPKLDERGLQIDSPEHELRRLLVLSGFPMPSFVESIPCTRLGDGNVFWSSFHTLRENSNEVKRSCRRAGYGFRIRFPEPVEGPLAVGYAAHMGMGSFIAQPEGNGQAFISPPALPPAPLPLPSQRFWHLFPAPFS
jgi:CRISPR-associated protein Csb2